MLLVFFDGRKIKNITFKIGIINFKIIKRINEEGTTILLVEQNAQWAFSIAEFGYILENGRIVLADTTQRLMEQEDVKEFYLGIAGDVSVKGYKRYKRKKRWR